MLIILGFVTYFNHVFVPAPFAALALEKSPLHLLTRLALLLLLLAIEPRGPCVVRAH